MWKFSWYREGSLQRKCVGIYRQQITRPSTSSGEEKWYRIWSVFTVQRRRRTMEIKKNVFFLWIQNIKKNWSSTSAWRVWSGKSLRFCIKSEGVKSTEEVFIWGILSSWRKSVKMSLSKISVKFAIVVASAIVRIEIGIVVPIFYNKLKKSKKKKIKKPM